MTQLLPNGWTLCALGDVLIIKNGYAFKSTTYSKQGIPLIRISNISDGEIIIDEAICIPNQFVKNEFLIERGDFLIALSGATTGKCGVYKLKLESLLNQRVANLKVVSDSYLFASYRNYYVSSLRKKIEIAAYGGAQPNMSPSALSLFDFHLPPLNEQKRITAKLDHIMPKIDGVKERLDRIPRIIKRFRQSVLTAAVTGQLTEKWREENPDVESADDLVKKINKEHEDKYNLLCKKAKKEGRRKPKKPKALEVFSDGYENKCDDWLYVKLDNIISELKNGLSPKPHLSPPGTPILRISSTRSGYVNLTDFRYMPNGDENYPDYLLREKDLLFTRYNGNIDYLGVCGLVRDIEDKKILYPDKLMRVRLSNSYILPEIIELIFQAPFIRKVVTMKSKSSAGQNGISGQDLKRVLIPILPLEEQKEIVRQVDKLFTFADKLELHYKKAKDKIDKLPQSVLAQAFRGELVPQDPNDEPAENLLERIKEEKARLEAEMKSKEKNARNNKAKGRKKKAV